MATGDEYDSNFVIDVHSPFSDASSVQSNGILIEDLVGDITLSDSLFIGNVGILGNNRIGIYPVPRGFSSRLIAFHRCELHGLSMDRMSFQSNMGEQEIYATTEQTPQLFSLEQSLFFSNVQQVTIRNLEMIGNKFYDSGSVVTFALQNLILEDLWLANNHGDSILKFVYLNDRVVTALQRPYVASNVVSAGSALRIEEYPLFELYASSASNFYQFSVSQGEFRTNEVAQVSDATESGPRASCIEIAGIYPSWASIRIIGTKFETNTGMITNDIYVDETVGRLEIKDIVWASQIDDAHAGKMAQFLYKPPHNSFELVVESSDFTCESAQYSERVVMNNDIESVQGRPSLFRLGESENVEKLDILQKEAYNAYLPDGWLDSAQFKLVFADNVYSGCN